MIILSKYHQIQAYAVDHVHYISIEWWINDDSFQSMILYRTHIPRLQNIITLFVWNYTRRGLLDSDKLTVVSMMCMNILVRVGASQRSREQTAGNLSPKGSWSHHHNPLVRPAIFSRGGRWRHLEGGKALRFPMIPRFGRWFSEWTANVPWRYLTDENHRHFPCIQNGATHLCKQDGCSLLTRKCLKPENNPQKRQLEIKLGWCNLYKYFYFSPQKLGKMKHIF